MRAKRPNRFGFTLTELIVVITVLSLLAGLAVPIYSKVRGLSKVAVVERTVAAVNRAAVAEASFTGVMTMEMATASASETKAPFSPVGGTYTTLVSVPSAPNPSSAANEISAYLAPDNVLWMAVALEEHCVMSSTDTNPARTWHIDGNATCSGIEAAEIDPVTELVVPGIPRDLSASATAMTSLKVTWREPINDGGTAITSYRVTTRHEGNDTVADVAVGDLTRADGLYRFNLTGLTLGDRYSFFVAATNAVGTGPFAGPSNSVLMTNLPSAPVLTGTSRDGGVDLSWSTSVYYSDAPIVGYRIYELNDEVFTLVGSTTSTSTIFRVEPRENGTSYTYHVAAYSSLGEGETSNEETIMPVGVPVSPTNLTASLDGTSVTLTWDTVAATTGRPVASIQILRGSTVVATLSAAATSFTQNGLSLGTSYTYTVRPRNSVGNATGTSVDVDLISTPTAPGTLSAVSGTESVTLSWAAVSATTARPVTGYRVYQSVAGVWTLVGVTATTGTTITGLTDGQAYSFRFAAYGTGGEGDWSSTATATPIHVPVPLTGLTITDIGTSSATYRWDAAQADPAAPTTKILVYRGNTLRATLDGSATEYSDSNLSASSSYTVTVRSGNRIGDSTGISASFETDGIVTPPVEPDVVPDYPVITAITARDTEVDLTWSTVTTPSGVSISGYRIYRNDDGVHTFIGSTANRTYTATGLTNGVTYTFSVSAYNNTYEGERSTGASSTPITTPGAVTNLGVTDNEDLSATLTWTNPTSTNARPVEQIHVLVDGVSAKVLAASATSTTVTGLTATSHAFAVKARNIIGFGTAATTTQTVTGTYPANAPTGLIAEPANGSVALSWTASSADATHPRTGYRIYQQNAGVMTLVGTTTATSYQVTGLDNGTSYSFQVTAYGSGGESTYTDLASATPLGAPAVTGLSATAGDSTITLDWNTVTSTSSAPVDEIIVSRGGTIVDTLSASATTYTSGTLTPGTTHTFTVRARNAVTTGSAATATVTIYRPSVAPNVTATPGDESVTLTWPAVSSTTGAPVVGYRVYEEIGGVATLVGALAGTTYEVTGLTNGAEYRFAVSAYGPTMEGARSGTVAATPISLPATITGLNETVGDETVAISWTQATSTTAAPVTGIDILRDGAVITTVTPTTTSYTYTSLTAGQEYTIGVRPGNALGTAAPTTTTVVARTIPAAPSAPSATAGDAEVTVDWTDVIGVTASSVTGYRVYRYSTGIWTLVATATSGPVTVTGLTNAVSHDFRIAAYGPAGEGERTTTVSATPLGTPATITGLVGTIGDRSLSMVWDVATATTEAPVTGVEVVQDGVVITTLSATATSYTVSDLTSGTAYTIGVRAKNARTSGAATTVSVIALAKPDAPANLTATAGDAHVELTWSAVAATTASPMTGYRVYRLIGGVMTMVGATANTTYDVTGLTNGEAATFAVATYGAAGEGLRSTEVTATPIADPTVITGLSASSASGSATLTWTGPLNSAAAPVTGYRIYRKIGVSYQLVATVANTVLTYSDTGLSNGATYLYQVAAYGPNAEGANAFTSTTLPDLPPAVTLTYIQAASGAFTVNYTSTPSVTQPITGFQVYVEGTSVKSGAANATSIAVASADVTGGLTNGSAYAVKVCAFNAQGESCSTTVYHTVGVVTTGATPSSGTTTFPHNDIFTTMGNGYSDQYTSAVWSQPVGSTVTASASSTFSGARTNGPTDHVDAGGVNTWSATASTAQWIQWDFGASRSVVPQGIMARWSNASWDTYLEGSVDGSNWTALWKRDITMPTDTAYYDIASWTNNDAYRYLRLYKRSTAAGWFNINELQIFGKVNLFAAPAAWTQTSYSGVTVPYASTAVQSGQYLYWAGGDLGTASRTRTNKTVRFDMASETLSYMADVPVTNTVGNTVLYNNQLYRFGGVSGTGTADTSLHVYDIAANSWRSIAGKGVSRYGAAAAVIGSTVYVFGGRTPGTNTSLATGIKMDLSQADASLAWTSAASFPWANLSTDMIVQSNQIFAFSGYNSSNQSQQTTYRYSPITNTWTQVSSPNNALVVRGIATLGDGRVALVGGMYTGDLVSGAVDIWNGANAVTGNLQWSGLQRSITARIGAGAGYYNGTLYVVGGVTSNPNYTPINSFEKHAGL